MDNFKLGKFSSKKEKNIFKILLFFQLRQEKAQLEHTLEQEQECLVNKLMRRIGKNSGLEIYNHLLQFGKC